MAVTVPSPPDHPALGPCTVTFSATLAANEAMEARRRRGEPVLPLGFGEAGLPVHPLLREALARAAGCNRYGPVAGHGPLREAAAGYWTRRGLPTGPDAIVCGPGSKALLYGLIAAIGGDVAVTRPSWVSYAAQASLAGHAAHFVPGPGGVPDAGLLDRAVRGRPGCGPSDPVGHRDAARQPDGNAGAAGRRRGAVLGGRGARPDRHLGRDLPRPDP